MRRLLFALLVTLLALGGEGCSCRKKSEDERLLAAIDSVKVHLWVASKVALDPTRDDARVKKARTDLGGFMDSAKAEDSPGMVKDLALALWELRGIGADLVARRKKDEPGPILPGLVGGEEGARLKKALDAGTEHALFLLVFALGSFVREFPHVPDELVLYEAWGTEPSSLRYATLRPPAHALVAFAFGQRDFCDLAAREEEAISGDGPLFDRSQLAADVLAVFGEKLTVPAEGPELDRYDAALRALAAGSVGYCYLARKDEARAAPAFERFSVQVERLGGKSADTKLFRAFASCVAGHDADGKALAAEVVADPQASEEQVTTAKSLVDVCVGLEGFDGSLSPVGMARLLFAVALRQLGGDGTLSSLLDVRVLRPLRRLAQTMSDTLAVAPEVVPSFDDAKKKAVSWWPF